MSQVFSITQFDHALWNEAQTKKFTDICDRGHQKISSETEKAIEAIFAPFTQQHVPFNQQDHGFHLIQRDAISIEFDRESARITRQNR